MFKRARHHLVSFGALAGLAALSLGGVAQAAHPQARSADSKSLTVFAAASLKETFTTIGTAFFRQTGVAVKLNFGGSDTLVNQLAQGAPADVLATANQAQMTIAASKGLIAGAPAVFVRNRLAVVVPKGNPGHVYSLPDLGRPGLNLVLAAPSVPAGKYARAAFAAMANDAAFGPDFLARIQANTKSQEVDVRAVLTKVALGEGDAGVVYVTDVTPAVANQVQTIPIPAAFNQIAKYPIAVTKGSGNAAAAQQFVNYVLSAAGQQVLQSAGFITTAPPGGYAASFQLKGLVQTPMTFAVADLQKLPATTISATLRTDTKVLGTDRYTGVLLNTLIQQAMPIGNSSFKNTALRMFVTVGATDNYQVTVGMAEILPEFGHQQILLAYAQNGQPLAKNDGAVELIVPGDNLAGRAVKNVSSITVGEPTLP